MIVLGGRQKDSFIHIHISILPQTPLSSSGTCILILPESMPSCCCSIYLHLSLFQEELKVTLYHRRNAETICKREEGEKKQENRA